MKPKLLALFATIAGSLGLLTFSQPQSTDAPTDRLAGIPKWNSRQEEGYLKAIRSYRTEIDGKPHRIIRGDLHRHTELSWDVGPGNDGSYLDFYRYMIDVAAMDFGGLTDHQGGGHYAYWWWLTEKSCDMYYLAPRKTTAAKSSTLSANATPTGPRTPSSSKSALTAASWATNTARRTNPA